MTTLNETYHLGQYNQRSIPVFALLVDGIVISIVLFISGLFYWNLDLQMWLYIWLQWFVPVNIVACIVYYIAYFAHNWLMPSACNPAKQCFISAVAWFITILFMLFVAYILKQSGEYSRKIITQWFLITPVILIVCKLLFFRYIAAHCDLPTIKAVIIGTGRQASEIACFLKTTPHLAIQLSGYYTAVQYDKKVKFPCDTTIAYLGDIEQCIQDAMYGKFELAYLCVSVEHYSNIKKIIETFSDTTVSLYFALPPEIFPNLLKPQWQFIAGSHMISIYESSTYGLNETLKRIEDLLFGIIILAVISFPMLLIAIMVKLSSPGPVMFIQKRYGLNGKEFDMYKFRTMYVAKNDKEVRQATKNDPRITPIGRFLRSFSLDELPQFINVLKGDMSIVGPRPHAVEHNEAYRKLIPNYMLRHKVKPGITGLAQINGCRGETDTPEKMANRVHYDLEYIRSWSPLLDIQIILWSIVKGFHSENAY